MTRATFASRLLSKTSEEYNAAVKAHREELKAMPSDAENLTAFLSNCTTLDDKPVLNKGEHADLENGMVTIKKSN